MVVPEAPESREPVAVPAEVALITPGAGVNSTSELQAVVVGNNQTGGGSTSVLGLAGVRDTQAQGVDGGTRGDGQASMSARTLSSPRMSGEGMMTSNSLAPVEPTFT